MRKMNDEDQKFLKSFEEKLKKASYTPLTDAELESQNESFASGGASNEMEGLYQTELEDKIFALVDKNRVPTTTFKAIYLEATMEEVQ